MNQFRQYSFGASSLMSQFWKAQLFGGVVLLLLGIAVLLAPELLAYFVAFIFIFAGVSLLVSAIGNKGVGATMNSVNSKTHYQQSRVYSGDF